MMAVALAAAFDPDYPLSRSLPTPPSARAPVSPEPPQQLAALQLQALSPRGAVAAADLRFRWVADGAPAVPCELVLLDEDMAEIHRGPVAGNECAVDAELRLALQAAGGFRGAQLFWFVAARGRAEAARSAPVAFAISR